MSIPAPRLLIPLDYLEKHKKNYLISEMRGEMEEHHWIT